MKKKGGDEADAGRFYRNEDKIARCKDVAKGGKQEEKRGMKTKRIMAEVQMLSSALDGSTDVVRRNYRKDKMLPSRAKAYGGHAAVPQSQSRSLAVSQPPGPCGPSLPSGCLARLTKGERKWKTVSRTLDDSLGRTGYYGGACLLGW